MKIHHFLCAILLCQNLAFAELNQSGEFNLNSQVRVDFEHKAKVHEPKKLDFSISSLYHNADIVVKVVIWILVLFSLLTWAVFFSKIFMYKALFQCIKKDKMLIDELENFDDLSHFPKSIARDFIGQIKDENTKSSYKDLSVKTRIKIRLDHKVREYCTKSRSFNALLASIGSSAPFIGLFGTVWGIMNAFIGISQQESVSLAVVAPGIAEALFATAFGLAAAIPAVLFYNYLVRLGQNFAHKLDENATMLYIIADRELSKTTQC